LLASAIVGCTPEMIAALVGSGRTSVPVYFVRAAGLEPPGAGKLTRVFKPAALFSAGADETAGPQVFEFQVVLAAESAARVEMQFEDARAGVYSPLERIAAPQRSPDSATSGHVISDAIRQKLAAGGGVFWHIGPDGGALEQRFGVILPAATLGPHTRLEFFTRRTSDGTPIGGESIELVPDFFYLAVLGDSVLWGNGLTDRDKIPALVAREIEQILGRRVITQLLAQSGATIVPGPDDGVCSASCNGEVPFVSTSVMTQVSLVDRPELVELALVDGCANDISIPKLLSPQTTDAELESLSVQFCNTAMIDLLRQVRTALPGATIIVTGYYAMISEQSSTLGLRAWEITRGAVGSEDDQRLVEELAHQSALFDELTTANLLAAVAAVRASDPALRIGFVDPEFGPANAAFAPETWLWGVTSENTLFEDLNLIQALNLDLFPEDPVQNVRLQLCFDPSNNYTLLDCLYVSLGHPNPVGARVYASGVIEALHELGLLPAPTSAD
jgi:hypothetical protein